MYQRTVMHARGWKQLPNYGLWSGIANWLWVRTMVSYTFMEKWRTRMGVERKSEGYGDEMRLRERDVDVDGNEPSSANSLRIKDTAPTLA